MIANVIASTAGSAAQVRAPLSAIAAASDGSPFVWLVDQSGVVSAQSVMLGEASGTEVVVIDGVTDGDTIIAAGVSQIIAGMTVRPITSVGN